MLFFWSDYYSPLQQLLHATFVNNNQFKCIGQNFKLSISFKLGKKSFGNCVWCWKWRLCGNVFLPYSNDRLTLPFTQIWFDMLKLGPCPNPATANPQTPTNFTIFQIKCFLPEVILDTRTVSLNCTLSAFKIQDTKLRLAYFWCWLQMDICHITWTLLN